MQHIFHNIDFINKMMGALYLLGALFYLLDWTLPFCVAMILVIVFAIFSIQNKSQSKTQAPSFTFRALGTIIFSIVILVKSF